MSKHDQLNTFTGQALDDAKKLGHNLIARDLSFFVYIIKQNKAVPIRRISKQLSVFLVYKDNTRFYPIYHSKFKSIVGFLSEQEARLNRGDEVQVLTDPPVKGKIVFVLSSYDDPRKPQNIQRFRQRGFDVTEIEQDQSSLRANYSYVIGYGEGDQKKVIWPPVSSIRKLNHAQENGN